MQVLFGRIISTIGHPLLLTPAAVLMAAFSHNAPVAITRPVLFVSLPLGLAVLVFLVWNVCSGRFAHIDASNPPERRLLNGFLAAVLLFSSAISWQVYAVRQLSIGLLISGLAIVVALALSPALKLSLHVCFAVIAAGYLWPNPFAFVGGIVITVAIAWSRLVLRRHTMAEVFAGALVGIACVVGYHMLVG